MARWHQCCCCCRCCCCFCFCYSHLHHMERMDKGCSFLRMTLTALVGSFISWRKIREGQMAPRKAVCFSLSSLIPFNLTAMSPSSLSSLFSYAGIHARQQALLCHELQKEWHRITDAVKHSLLPLSRHHINLRFKVHTQMHPKQSQRYLKKPIILFCLISSSLST